MTLSQTRGTAPLRTTCPVPPGGSAPRFVARGARRVPAGAGSVDFLPVAGSVQCSGQFSARDCNPRGGREKNKPRKAKPAFLLLHLRPSLGAGPHVLRDGGGRLDRAFGSGWNFLFFAIPAGVGGSPAPQTTASALLFPCQARHGATSARRSIGEVWWQSPYLSDHLAVAEGSTSQC